MIFINYLYWFLHVFHERRRSASVVLLLLSTPGLALAGAEGEWTVGDPRACAVELENVMLVERDRFTIYEDGCAFGARAPIGFRAVSGVMSCSVEGEDYVDTIRMDARGDRLRLTRGGDRVSVWRRCAPDARAAGGGGEIDPATALVVFGVILDRMRRAD